MKSRGRSEILLLFVISVGIVVLFHWFLRDNFGIGVRLFNDDHDRYVYYLRGTWYPLHVAPYTGVFSEYPQLATYFFALPHAMLSFWTDGDYLRDRYYLLFSILMMGFLSATILTLYRMRADNRHYAFLMFLPASLYYSYNRYDILPAFLSVVALLLLSKAKYRSAVVMLALGVLAKWYLFLMFPVFLSYYYSKHRKIGMGLVFVFCLTLLGGILPTLLSGGVDALMVPYKFHAGRENNTKSLFYLLYLTGLVSVSKPWFLVFTLLQFSIVPLSALVGIHSMRSVIAWSALTVFVFMLFGKFFSPQWILWVSPFLILLARDRRDVSRIVLFDLVTYLHFPVVYDGAYSLLTLASAIRIGVMTFLIVVVGREVVGELDLKSGMLEKLRFRETSS